MDLAFKKNVGDYNSESDAPLSIEDKIKYGLDQGKNAFFLGDIKKSENIIDKSIKELQNNELFLEKPSNHKFYTDIARRMNDCGYSFHAVKYAKKAKKLQRKYKHQNKSLIPEKEKLFRMQKENAIVNELEYFLNQIDYEPVKKHDLESYGKRMQKYTNIFQYKQKEVGELYNRYIDVLDFWNLKSIKEKLKIENI